MAPIVWIVEGSVWDVSLHPHGDPVVEIRPSFPHYDAQLLGFVSAVHVMPSDLELLDWDEGVIAERARVHEIDVLGVIADRDREMPVAVILPAP